MERIDNIGFDNIKLIQDEDGFLFGVDAVILSDFAAGICPSVKEIADLGTGNGVIPMILSHKLPESRITGFDVQAKAIDIASRNAELNSLTERISFIRCDVKQIVSLHPEFRSRFKAVVSNPPYVARGGGIINEKDARFVARQETTATLEDFIEAAAAMLESRGHLFMIHRPSRLVDIFYYCRKNRLEPKDIRFVAPTKGKAPNMVMVHCVQSGGHELKFADTLYVYDDSGNYSPEICKIYEKTG